jgi:glycosyltransferase involved in cell wall biosynthesis
MNSNKIAVLIPCYNEELTIKNVIEAFKQHLPNALIYVYDNNSTDNTYNIAKECGVIVKKEPRQGKGNVVRSMFSQIQADIYILIDGDDTYPVENIHELLLPILDGSADMVIGDRHTNGTYEKENKRLLHNFGNHLVKNIINSLFKSDLKDIMSGYRVFNKKFVKNIPIVSDGFEIETEMTLHALDKKFILKEVPINYKDRIEGSLSKLNTLSDGLRVLHTIGTVFKDYKPLRFFSVISLLFFCASLLVGIPVINEFLATSYVNKIPSAILSVGLMLISILSLFCGFILDTIVKNHNENYLINLNKWIDDNYHQ